MLLHTRQKMLHSCRRVRPINSQKKSAMPFCTNNEDTSEFSSGSDGTQAYPPRTTKRSLGVEPPSSVPKCRQQYS